MACAPSGSTSPISAPNGRLIPATWPQAFEVIAAKVKAAKPGRIGAIAGDLAAVEEMYALKDLMTRLGSKNLDASQDGAALNPAQGRATYLFNATIAGIERADALLIVGSNPRREAAVLNARIRKRWRAGKFPIALIGEKVDLTYPYDYLGAGPDTLAELAGGKHSFAEVLKGAERPLIIVGAGALARPDGAAVAALAAKAAIELGAVKEGWNGYQRAAHRGLARRRAGDRLCAGRGRAQRRRDGQGRRARRALPARRRRDRRAARRLRRSISAPTATTARTAPT